MTIVAIHQPHYLPWIPYIEKADAADVFVYLDHVQYQKNGVQNRNQIKTATGPIWLTVPVAAPFGTPINKAPIANAQWRKKHLHSIEQSYAKARYAGLVGDGLKEILERDWEFLGELNIAVTEWLFSTLGITAKRIRSSELAATGTAQDLILRICKEAGADVYLSGRGAAAYQDPKEFARAGIELQYQNFEQPTYTQCFPNSGFLPDLSALDMVLNCGGASLDIIRNQRQISLSQVGRA
jgi:hypothetical protein